MDKRDLRLLLGEARDLLRRNGQGSWAANFERAADLAAEDGAKGADYFLGFFGGMGSLTDRLPIDAGPDGEKFKALVNEAWTTAYRHNKRRS